MIAVDPHPTATPSPASGSGTGSATGGPDPSHPAPAAYGSTTLTTRAIERIAAQVAFEVPQVGADAGGVLGIGARREFTFRPSATASLYGRVIVLRFDVGIGFPCPLTAVLSRLRAHVRARVEELTGLTVGRMDVSVTWLHPNVSRSKELQ